jgi:hypothetical protein
MKPLILSLFCLLATLPALTATAAPKVAQDLGLATPSLMQDAPHAKNDFRFVEIKKTATLKSLPPQLEVTFEKFCNEDLVDPQTHKTTILVGVIVKTLPMSSCGGIQKNQTANAGNLFSGREYEVKLISTK